MKTVSRTTSIGPIADDVIKIASLERTRLKAASGSPTITGIHFVNESGEQVAFNPGVADTGSLALSSSWTGIVELWEAATGREWQQVMSSRGLVGIVPVVVGGTGAVAVSFGDSVADTALVTYAAGETLRLGRLPEAFQVLTAQLLGGGIELRPLDKAIDSVVTHADVDPDELTGAMPADQLLDADTSAEIIPAPAAGLRLVLVGISLCQTTDHGCGVQLCYDDEGDVNIGGLLPAPANFSGLAPVRFPRPIKLPEATALKGKLSTVADSQAVSATVWFATEAI